MAKSSSIERFHSRDRHLYRFIGTKESLYVRKGLVWNSNMAAVSLLWNSYMAAMTPCENALQEVMTARRHKVSVSVPVKIETCVSHSEWSENIPLYPSLVIVICKPLGQQACKQGIAQVTEEWIKRQKGQLLKSIPSLVMLMNVLKKRQSGNNTSF